MAGEAERAEAIIDDRLKSSPNDFSLTYRVAPQVRAEAELSREGGDPSKAIDTLEVARPYEGEAVKIPYLRGMAFLRAQLGAQAAAEFQKVVDRFSREPFSVVHSLAHLGLARATAMTGDHAASRKAYQDFLALWRDADLDIPVLQEAKAEYEKVSQSAPAAIP